MSSTKGTGRVDMVGRNVQHGFTVLLTLILVVQSGILTMKFLDYETYTETHIVPQYHAEFPEVTFCSSHNGYKLDILKVHFECSFLNTQYVQNMLQFFLYSCFDCFSFDVEEPRIQ